MRLPGILSIARPGNALLSAAGVWAGALLAGAPLSPSWRVALGMASAVAFAGAGNVRNDLEDVELDRAAHPGRPLVTGEVRPAVARGLAVALYAVSLACAALVGLPALVLVALALPLMEGYERRLKREGLPGNLAVAALTAAPFLMGAFAVGIGAGDAGWLAFPPIGPAVLAMAFLAVLANAAREVLKDAEDMDADRGRRATLPLRIGAQRAGWVAAALLGVAVLLSPLPFVLESVLAWPYLAAVGLADACFLAAAAVGARSPARGQRLAKAGMVLALVAIVVGRGPGGLA